MVDARRAFGNLSTKLTSIDMMLPPAARAKPPVISTGAIEMTLKERIRGRTGDLAGAGVVGEEGGWLAVGLLEVPKGRLLAVDVCMFNEEDGATVDVPPGTYVVEGRAMDFEGHLRVSRMRAYLRGTNPALGDAVGEAGTDSGMIAIGDIADIDGRVAGNDTETFAEMLFEVTVEGGEVQSLDVNGHTVTYAVCESGFGDGGYPVFALVDGGRTVGVEVEFIAPGQTVEEE